MTHSDSRASSSSASSAWPLSALRVLDLSSQIAGPYAAKLCGDAGADVIKVESGAGDPMRRHTASGQDLKGRDAPLFQFLNGGKRGVLLDLETEAGRDQLLSLARHADLVIEDFGAGGLERLGLSVEALQAQNEALSVVSISPFGLEGPWANRPATEFTLQAEVGGTAYRGLPERGPLQAGGRLGEWSAGSCAAVGALGAWRSARASGRGQHVDVSILESMSLTMTTYHDLFGQFTGVPLAQALELPSIEPAKDGWVGLCTYTGQQWKDLCALIGRPEVGEDERFFDGRTRMENIDFIQELIHAWTKEQTIEEIVELVSLMRIPVAPIGDGKRVLEIDHFVERGVFQDHPDGFKAPRVPYLVSGMSTPGLRSAPTLGEHTESVLAELGSAGSTGSAETPGSVAAGDADGAGASEIPLPFAGLRIVDLTAFWAGPVVTASLGAMGADVVKIESCQRPDGMRFAGAIPGERMWERSPVYHGCNQSKRAITLNLDGEEGKSILRKLLEDADVVIENFSARVMENFGFDWDTLHSINPKLISVRMPAWGLDGPWRDRTGFAPNVEQASGMAWITGYADLPMIPRGVCDPVGGMHTIVALVTALEERGRTGQGMLVEVPLVEPALNLAVEQVLEWSVFGELLGRSENRGPTACPQAVFSCQKAEKETRYTRDQVAIAIETDAQWAALVAFLGSPDWATASALETESGRRSEEDAIETALAAEFASRECDALVEGLVAAGIPASTLVNAHFISPNPQLESRQFFQTFSHPVAGDMRYPDLPFRYSSRPNGLHRTPPPVMGEHNEEILGGELGLSHQELATLQEKNVIGDRPSFEIG
ncbi:MAG: CaiB/BaiF CoA transferase family protein [Myxococcota bacterium]